MSRKSTFNSILQVVFCISLAYLAGDVKCKNVLIKEGQPQYISQKDMINLSSCKPSLDIAFVVDVTASQTGKIEITRDNLKALFQALDQKYDYRVAYTTFTDKNVRPLGYNRTTWVDYCLKIRTKFTDPFIDQINFLDDIYIGGGQDLPESNWDSFLRAALAPQIEWNTGHVTQDNRPYVKILVLVTDAYGHEPGELFTASMINDDTKHLDVLPNSLTKEKLAADPNNLCAVEDYPTLKQVGRALIDNHYLPIILTSPATYLDKNNIAVPYPELKLVAAERGDPTYADPIKGMELYNTQALKDMGLHGFVQTTNSNTAVFVDEFMRALNNLLDLEQYCTPNGQVPSLPDNECSNDCPYCCGNVDIRVNVTVS